MRLTGYCRLSTLNFNKKRRGKDMRKKKNGTMLDIQRGAFGQSKRQRIYRSNMVNDLIETFASAKRERRSKAGVYIIPEKIKFLLKRYWNSLPAYTRIELAS